MFYAHKPHENTAFTAWKPPQSAENPHATVLNPPKPASNHRAASGLELFAW